MIDKAAKINFLLTLLSPLGINFTESIKSPCNRFFRNGMDFIILNICYFNLHRICSVFRIRLSQINFLFLSLAVFEEVNRYLREQRVG